MLFTENGAPGKDGAGGQGAGIATFATHTQKVESSRGVWISPRAHRLWRWYAAEHTDGRY